MKVKVYFLREPHEGSTITNSITSNHRPRIGKQALLTIYDMVWEGEFKNMLNVGRIWLKFRYEAKPFGISLREKKSHCKIAPGDIIQIANDFYMVSEVGARKIELKD
jgi:hypothetical protein